MGMVVKDAVGKTLEIGDRIAWIANPSRWDREIRKGILVKVNEKAGRYGNPTLTVLAEENPYGDLGYGFKATKESTLVSCTNISPVRLDRTHFMFSRVIKL